MIIQSFISVLFSLYTYRSIFDGKLLGDPFDSRLMIVLHEHWWRWLNGYVALRDTEFFYPYDTALGYSDVFLVQGFLYSFIRLLGQGLANSWTITTFILLVIGNLGWVFVANKFLKSNFIRTLFLLTIISSLSFVNYFTLNPNIVGYSFLSWLSLLYLNIENEKRIQFRIKKISTFIIIMLIYALSCWYGAFFFTLTFLTKIIIQRILSKQKFAITFRNLHIKIIAIFLPAQILLIWLFLYIYVSVSNQPFRPTDEMIRNSPRIQLLPNGAELNGSIFRNLYEFFKLDFEQEYTIGIGIILTVAILIFSLYFIKKNFRNPKDLSWLLSVTFVYSFFIIIQSDFSLHKFFFENIPGFNSIRTPSRYVIIVGYFSIFGISYLVDKYLKEVRNLGTKFLMLILLLAVFLDQQRTPYSGWNRSEMINTDLHSQKLEILDNCDYFYYDYPGGWWYDQIEAMVFGAQIGMPTVNGYSGAFPPGYPTEPFNSEKLPLKIFDWIDKIDDSERGCFVTGRSPVRKLSKNNVSLDLIGFRPGENNDADFWQWSVSPNPYLYLINLRKKNLTVNFKVNPGKCLNSMDLKIVEVPDKILYEDKISSDGTAIELNLNFSSDIVKRIELITSSEGCRIEGDPLTLYFEVKNLTYK